MVGRVSVDEINGEASSSSTAVDRERECSREKQHELGESDRRHVGVHLISHENVWE